MDEPARHSPVVAYPSSRCTKALRTTVVRTIMEDCRTLKFDSFNFESEYACGCRSLVSASRELPFMGRAIAPPIMFRPCVYGQSDPVFGAAVILAEHLQFGVSGTVKEIQ